MIKAIINDSHGEHKEFLLSPEDTMMYGLPATWNKDCQKLNEGVEPS
jgi:hypothetical protein